MESKKRLTRTKSADSILFGVCGGIAKFFGIDSTIVRIIWAVITVVGFGSPILIYLLMAIIVPKDT